MDVFTSIRYPVFSVLCSSPLTTDALRLTGVLLLSYELSEVLAVVERAFDRQRIDIDNIPAHRNT